MKAIIPIWRCQRSLACLLASEIPDGYHIQFTPSKGCSDMNSVGSQLQPLSPAPRVCSFSCHWKSLTTRSAAYISCCSKSQPRGYHKQAIGIIRMKRLFVPHNVWGTSTFCPGNLLRQLQQLRPAKLASPTGVTTTRKAGGTCLKLFTARQQGLQCGASLLGKL